MAKVEEYKELIKALKDTIEEQNDSIREIRVNMNNEIAKANKFIDGIEDIYKQVKCKSCKEHANCYKCIIEQLKVKVEEVRK